MDTCKCIPNSHVKKISERLRIYFSTIHIIIITAPAPHQTQDPAVCNKTVFILYNNNDDLQGDSSSVLTPFFVLK